MSRELRCAVCNEELGLFPHPFEGKVYCGSCVKGPAFGVDNDTEGVVSRIEGLGHIGANLWEQAFNSLERVHTGDAAFTRGFLEAWNAVRAEKKEMSPDERDRKMIKRALKEDRTGDQILAQDVLDLVILGDSDYRGRTWLSWIDAASLGALVQAIPEGASFAELIRLAKNPSDLRSDFEENVGTVVLGWQGLSDADDLLVEPWVGRLERIEALTVVLGLARMVELDRVLRNGTPPPDSYSEEERRFLLTFESANFRRAARAGDFLAGAPSWLPPACTRAEQLEKEWLLHPTSPQVGRYLRLLHRCYIAGFDPESIIVCRSILEGTVRRCMQGLGGDPSAEMRARIDLLQQMKWLSPKLAGRARDIWIRGNKVVHDDPGAVTNAWETIQDTLAVVQALDKRLPAV